MAMLKTQPVEQAQAETPKKNRPGSIPGRSTVVLRAYERRLPYSTTSGSSVLALARISFASAR